MSCHGSLGPKQGHCVPRALAVKTRSEDREIRPWVSNGAGFWPTFENPPLGPRLRESGGSAEPTTAIMNRLSFSKVARMRLEHFPIMLLLLFSALPLSASPQESADIKVESKLVLVDVTAFDEAGNPITDLRREEFEVSENGKRVDVSFFERRHVSADQQRVGHDLSPANPKQVDAAAPGVLLVVMVDLPSIPATDLPRVKAAIESFVQAGRRPEDALMLAATNLAVVQPPTREVGRFLDALKRLSPVDDGSSELLRFASDLERLLNIANAAPMRKEDVTRQAIDLGQRYIRHEKERTRNATRSALALIREIATLPGRKNVVYFSGGYHCRIGTSIQETLLNTLPDVHLDHLDSTHLWIRSQLGVPASITDLDSMVNSVIDEANRSQVSFYTADGRGLRTQSGARFGTFAIHGDDLEREDINQSQHFLRVIADGTGGRHFLNTNDLGTGLRGAYRDASDHYELGYVPPGKSKPGSVHQISVKVLRPHVDVLHRRSYMEPTEYDTERRSIENGLRFPELFRDFPFEVDTFTERETLKVGVYIPVRTLLFSRQNERHKCELSVHMALFDGAGELYDGKILYSRTYHLDFDPVQFDGLANIDNLTASYEGRVKPGDYRLRVVVRQTTASRTAALEKRITVP